MKKLEINSFLGSVIQTAAILNGSTDSERNTVMIKIYNKLMKKKEYSVRQIFKTAFELLNKEDAPRTCIANVILLTDNSLKLSPRVTLLYGDAAMPLDKSGVCKGIIQKFNDDYPSIEAEPLFDSYDDYNNEVAL